jgi:hypothetical protein
MPARIELTYDASRGPGYALCRITGLGTPPGTGGLEIRIQRNQDGGYLRPGRAWGASEAWIPIGPARAEGNALALVLGPDIVDELATAPASVRFLCHLRTDGRLEAAALGSTRMLRPSGADGAGPAAETVADPTPIANPTPIAEPAAPAPEPAPEASPLTATRPDFQDAQVARKPRAVPAWTWAVAAVVVLLVAGGTLWQLGLPPFAAPAEEGDAAGEQMAAQEPVPEEPMPEEPVAAQARAPASAAIETLQDVNLFIRGEPSADEALAEAQGLLKRGKTDLSFLLFQHAARHGSADASVAVARFYDPATWSERTSPLPQADAETAAYWYEPAALAGSVEAQRRLGKILVDLDLGEPQRAKGVEWLRKAADAGDDEARALLETLE